MIEITAHTPPCGITVKATTPPCGIQITKNTLPFVSKPILPYDIKGGIDSIVDIEIENYDSRFYYETVFSPNSSGDLVKQEMPKIKWHVGNQVGDNFHIYARARFTISKDNYFYSNWTTRQLTVEQEPMYYIFNDLEKANFYLGDTDEMIIDWGDGNVVTYTDNSSSKWYEHSYASKGTYKIKVLSSEGVCTIFTQDWNLDDLVEFNFSNFKPYEMMATFYGYDGTATILGVPDLTKCVGLIRTFQSSHIATFPNLEKWNTTHISNMYYLFAYSNSFNQDISSWDVSNVTNMGYMFKWCKTFNQDISSWDVSNVTDMQHMFYVCDGFTQDISNWDVSNVTDMSYMFNSIDNFNQDISSWDVSNVTNMEGLLRGLDVFNQDISSWDVSNVTNMSFMFQYSPKFNQDISSWDVSNVTNMRAMFGHTDFNQPLNSWDVSNVTNMKSMFNGTKKFNQPLDKWNTANVTDMSEMFSDGAIFCQDLSGWDVGKVEHHNLFYCNNSFHCCTNCDGDGGKKCDGEHCTDDYIPNWS